MQKIESFFKFVGVGTVVLVILGVLDVIALDVTISDSKKTKVEGL